MYGLGEALMQPGRAGTSRRDGAPMGGPLGGQFGGQMMIPGLAQALQGSGAMPQGGLPGMPQGGGMNPQLMQLLAMLTGGR